MLGFMGLGGIIILNFYQRRQEKLKEEKEAIQFEYEKIYDKMEEILPRATSASYFQVLQGVNHDIRNHLIKIKAKLFQYSKELRLEEKNPFQELNTEIENRVKYISNLLRLFRIDENNKKEAICINETINQVILFFQNSNQGIEFKIHTEKELPNLYCHKTEFSMIIYNLINNSIDAIKSKGKKFKGEIKLETNCRNKEFEISIIDNGKGIKKELFNTIFELGVTSKKKEGHGIGLFFVKNIIEKKFAGTINVQSKVGKSTHFKICIPENINYD